jgi:hypothetical protein
MPAESAVTVWDAIVLAGRAYGLKPAGCSPSMSREWKRDCCSSTSTFTAVGRR